MKDLKNLSLHKFVSARHPQTWYAQKSSAEMGKNMDIKVVERQDLIVLQEEEVQKENIDRCFREYQHMAKVRNTVFVVDRNDAFVGIITLHDYLNHADTGNFVNRKARKIVADKKSNVIAAAWEIKQEYDFLRMIPVVDSGGNLLYGIRIEDTQKVEKDIRDFEFWLRKNKEQLLSKYQDADIVCVVGEKPFHTAYVARLLKECFAQVSMIVLGTQDWVFREKDMAGQIQLANADDITQYHNLISIDMELYGVKCDSIVALSGMMSKDVLTMHSQKEDMRDIVWLHIGDLLSPLEGKITAVQIFIISRILDVERRKMGLPFYWQNRFNEFFWPEMSEEQERAMEKRADLLIHSIENRGFSPNISAGSITEYPVGMNDGAHRTAYHAVYFPHSFLPYYIGTGSLTASFWPYNGEEFFLKAGLPMEELKELKDRYLKLLDGDEVRSSLTGYMQKEYFEKLERGGVMSGYGYITEICDIKFHGIDVTVFRIKLKRQRLILIRNTLFSQYIENLKRDIRVHINPKTEWDISGSVTMSVEMENDLEKECMQELKFKQYEKG